MTDMTQPDDTPHSRDDAPWSHNGDAADPDWGALFARPVAGRSVMLSFDRDGRRHAMTLFDPRELGSQLVLNGRRFDVRRYPAYGEAR